MVTLDRGNPFSLVGDGVRDTGHGITMEFYRRKVMPSPLITQQDAAVSLLMLSRSIPIERRSPLFDLLARTDQSVLERMLCGPASALTSLRALQSDTGKPAHELINSTHITSLLAEICALDGRPSINPQTGVPFDNGWQVFSKPTESVGNREIYHHALAYGMDILTKGLTITKGVKEFTTNDLANLSRNGSKIIVSVSNLIIESDQVHPRESRKLREGSHLVAIVGFDDVSEQIYLADPYVEAFSVNGDDPIPRLVSLESLEKFLKPIERRRGLVVSLANNIPEKVLRYLEYPLARPNS